MKVFATRSGPAAWIGVSGPANSRMRWRQAPQGVTRPAPSPQTNTGLDVNPALYDTLGRVYRIGVRAKF